MVNQLIKKTQSDIIYPVSDGEPVAETFDHVYVMMTTLLVLRHYLAGQRATVLGDQFMYYVEGKPNARVAPDVMVIFNVEPGGRDSYKIWEEQEVPSVIFEMTSKGPKERDQIFKKNLYEQLGVTEYWLYDPRGEWIIERLLGYRLRRDVYEPITDARSEPLNLRVQIEDSIIGFYREDTGDKLLIPDELLAALERETEQRRQAEARAATAEAKANQVQRAAVSRLATMGLAIDQVAEALGLTVTEVQAITDASTNLK